MTVSSPLRVAMCSRWHVHANEYAGTIQRNADAKISAVWDEDEERGQRWAEELSVPFESELMSLLARDDVDAICVVTPTNMHREVMVAAARAGKHIFTEKVLAASNEDAVAIAESVRESDVKFCISFPRRNMPQIRYAKDAIDQGLLGDVTAIRIRIAHAGASRDWLPAHFYDPIATQGGAMMDLGAHGMYLSRWFGGSPVRVSSVFTNLTDKEVEDNAISLIEFENGAIAVNETSFVAYPDSYSIEIDGTKGGFRMLSPGEGVAVRSDSFEERGWQTPSQLPPAGVAPVDQWVSACINDTPIEYGMTEALQLTELMDAAYRSHTSGASERVEIVSGD